MPIRPELRHLYGPAWKEKVRPKIVDRAGGRCEACGARGGDLVLNRHGWTWRVVLTVAHLNHMSGDDRDENLRCWCARCHLVYDTAYHRLTRSQRKDAGRPLLGPIVQAGSSACEIAVAAIKTSLPGQVTFERRREAAKRPHALLRPQNLDFLFMPDEGLPLLDAVLSLRREQNL